MRPWLRTTAFGLLLLPLAATAEPFAYAIDSDFEANLLRIDLATGQTQVVGPVGFFDVEGLAFGPDGTLHGADDTTKTLLRLSLATGAGIPVGGATGNLGLPTGLGSQRDFGLAFDCRGRLWLSSSVTGSLWQIDPASGAIVDEHSLEPRLTGLAARGDWLWGVTSKGNETLYRYNPDTRALVAVGPLELPATPVLQDAGLDFDADGNLWMIGDYILDPNLHPSRIHRIDTSTGLATFVATARPGIEGLAIAPTSCENVVAIRPDIVPGPGPLGLLVLGGLLGAAGARRLRAARR